MSLRRLIEGINQDPYNEVSAHRLPDGGIVIMLSHRITMDKAVMVRVQEDADVAFLYDDTLNSERVERVNQGGPWEDPDMPGPFTIA